MGTRNAQRPLSAAPGYSLTGNLRGVAGVLRNLSGFGRKTRLDRLLSPRVVVQRIPLVTADGDTITVEVSGAGRPMLLVHGLGGSHHDWDAAVEHLAGAHRVYTIDLRGHGARARVNARPTLDAMAGDVAQVIDRLGLDKPLLVGHSMGALVVMQYLRQHGSSRLSGVCFVDQSPRITIDARWDLGLFGSLTRQQLESAADRLEADFVGTVMAEASRKIGSRPHRARHGLFGRVLHRAVARVHAAIGTTPVLAILDSLAYSDFRDVIERLRLPTLVVLGGSSHHYGGLPLAEYYLGALAQGTVITYDTCAHSPHRQVPVDFANDLMDFAARTMR